MLTIIPFPNVSTQADWFELSCLFSADAGISYSELSEYLEQNGLDDPEVIVEDTMQELTWRETMLGDEYPFTIHDDNILKRDWKENLAYTYQLLLSTHKLFHSTSINTRSRTWKDAAKLFERFVTVAMKNYLGSSFNIGWPRKGGVPRNFLRSLEFASRVIKERPGPFEWRPHWTGDQGVDVIAWGRLDNRTGKVISLINCAAGDDWNEKLHEVVVDRWTNYIDFKIDPLRGMAFPFICRDSWYRSMSVGGILYDRLRLTYLFEKNKTSYLRRNLTKWSQTQIGNLPLIEE